MPRVALALALLAAAPAAAGAAGTRDDRPLSIVVITMGPGEELFTRFGHIALMVDDRERRTRDVYNFGTFRFDDPDLQVRYARGFLVYWLSVSSYSKMVRKYREADRELTIRELDLTADQAAEIARRLEINALPENREYDYRHYLDNCCTRIRDLVDDITGGAVGRGRRDAPTGRTFRYWTARALEGLPLMGSIILFSLGPAIDRPITRWDEEFLPEVLAEDLDAARIGPDDRPLVLRKRVVVARRGPPVSESVPTADAAVIGVLAALLVLGLLLPCLLGERRGAARLAGLGLFTWGLVAGLGGLLLTLFWTVTEHTDTHWNENLLVAPPLHLWLIGPGLALLARARVGRRAASALGWYLIASIALVLADAILKAGPFFQGNWDAISLALACDAGAYAALRASGAIPRPHRRLP